jgi:hypothetical protein
MKMFIKFISQDASFTGSYLAKIGVFQTALPA